MLCWELLARLLVMKFTIINLESERWPVPVCNVGMHHRQAEAM